MTRHSIPEFFIKDMKASGWEPQMSNFEGNTGAFHRKLGNRNLVSFAQIWEKNAYADYWRFKPIAKMGPAWFDSTFKKIAGYRLFHGCFHSYQYDNWTGGLNYIDADDYTSDFITTASDDLVAWAEGVNLRQAFEFAALLRGSFEVSPVACIYIAALATLGKRETLLQLAEMIADPDNKEIERHGGKRLTYKQIQLAIECCDYPEKFGIPSHALQEIRGQ